MKKSMLAVVFVSFVILGQNAAQNVVKKTVKPTPSVSKPQKVVAKPVAKPVVKTVEPNVPFNTKATPLPLFTQPVKLKKGLSFNLNVPKGYHVSVAYEGLNRLRFLSLAPDDGFLQPICSIGRITKKGKF